MNFKILLSLFKRKLSIRIFSALFAFILLLSFIFYYSGKTLLLTNAQNHFFCTFSSCSNSLSTELNLQKNLVIVSGSILKPILSKSIAESKVKNLENTISRELKPILKNYNSDILFIRFLPITKAPYDYITFTKQEDGYFKEKGTSKNKKLILNSEWWLKTLNEKEYFGSYFPNKNDLVYSTLIYYNGIPSAIVGAVIKKENINSAFFKLNSYNSMKFYILDSNYYNFYSSSEFQSYNINELIPFIKNNNDFTFKFIDDSVYIFSNFINNNFIIASIDKNEFYLQLFYLKLSIFLFFILTLILSIFISIAVEKKLSKPMSRILSFFKSASNGNFSTSISPISNGDFGEIERSFNSLIASLKNLNSELIISKTYAEYTTFSKTQFISNISREIRAPLNCIAGIIDDIKTTSLTESQKRQVSLLETSAGSMIDTFNEIIEFLKIESGTSVLKISELNLKDLVLSIASTYYFSSEHKGISFSTYIDKSIPSLLFSDKNKISIILSSLLDNAVKFTESGSISLSVLNTEDFPEFCSVTFSISDTGKGVTPDKIKQSFSNFSPDEILNKYNNGLGIGLTIVRHNLKILGSSLEFSSQENGGSKFFFTISFKKVNTKNNIQNNLSTGDFGKKNVLVVDDNPANLDIIETFLKDESFTLFKAYSGKEALSIIEDTHLDIILLDLQMPEMNGFQISRIIREREGNTGRHIPIIAMTAYVLNEEYDECILSGMDDCLTKPFNSNEISDIIKKWI